MLVQVANWGSNMGGITDLLTMGCPGGMRSVCDETHVPTVMINYHDATLIQRWVREGKW